jgi:ABC-type phosphate/phosphonate transport system ATPase subunit
MHHACGKSSIVILRRLSTLVDKDGGTVASSAVSTRSLKKKQSQRFHSKASFVIQRSGAARVRGRRMINQVAFFPDIIALPTFDGR